MKPFLVLLASTLLAGAAQAEPRTLAWSTYLRSAPGPHAPVIDEVEHDQTLDVGRCDAGWCEVRSGLADGWIDADSLRASTKVLLYGSTLDPAGGCVSADQKSFARMQSETFCAVTPHH